jgi:hypothetical protein
VVIQEKEVQKVSKERMVIAENKVHKASVDYEVKTAQLVIAEQLAQKAQRVKLGQ